MDYYNYENEEIQQIVTESLTSLMLENDSYLTESPTIDVLKEFFSTERKKATELIHDARKSIKRKNYRDAMVKLKEAQKLIKVVESNINKIDEDALDGFLANIIEGFLAYITAGLFEIANMVEGIWATRSLRAVGVKQSGKDYTEDLFQRLFRPRLKDRAKAIINFMSNSIDKTIVSLDKLIKEEKKEQA